ncbi:MAG: cation transporter [Dehalococcoidia bacterium]|nr:cation transporter [Dehalococcoidia bacterium]
MAHGHPAHTESPQRVLLLGLVLSLAFVVIEAVTGVLTGSLALLSDAGHALADSAGLLLALAAATLARRPAGGRRTYGYARFEVLAVPVHVALLLGIAGYIIFEAISRAGDSHDVDAVPVIGVGLAGLAVNLVVVRMLHTHAHDNLNARAARLEAGADALSSVAVVASAAAIALGAWDGLDVVVALAIAAFVVPRSLLLLRHAADILLESAPPGLDPAEIMAAGSTVDGVVALHDVHVWSIAPSFPALSAHVELTDVRATERILTELTVLLRDRFGIGHVTLQPETPALHEAIACCLSPDAARMTGADHEHPVAR